MMAIFSFPEHVPGIFCCVLCACVRDDAIGGTMEESGRESQVKIIDSLQVIGVVV